MHRPPRSRGFSLIELVVVVAVLGILSSLTVINLGSARVSARDASRKDSVKAYQQSLEQYRSSRGTYFVYKSGPVTQSVIYSHVGPDTDGSGHMVADATERGNLQYVGYLGGGWGRITTKNVQPNYPNSTLSIADALQQDGYLAEVRTDPRATGFSSPLGDSSNPSAYNDYLLALCKADGSQASTPQEAVEYAVFANLERPSAQPADAQDPTHLCGGNGTGNGWNTLVYGGLNSSLALR